ncbi:hypothetical protein M422DRAFT_44668 [Sphaerobolus stellatus SS14]|nr:hypothetical protein M422DRAFT_44668 [Sphaerobolus stellatus SS14]
MNRRILGLLLARAYAVSHGLTLLVLPHSLMQNNTMIYANWHIIPRVIVNDVMVTVSDTVVVAVTIYYGWKQIGSGSYDYLRMECEGPIQSPVGEHSIYNALKISYFAGIDITLEFP